MANNNVPTSFDVAETLHAWAEAIEREVAEITASIMALQQRLDAANEKRDLVRRLMHLSSPMPDRLPGEAEQLRSSPQSASLPGIEDRVEEILRSTATPMHIRDIRASLIQMGVPLPGRGDEANIILRLRRDTSRFVRTGRGTYALVAWELPAYSPAPRKKKVAKRRTASK